MRAILLSLAFFLFAPAAYADYRSEFAAYRQALKDGDYVKAAKHGEAAWRAAEKELGDTKTTAILAFNYAELVVTREPAKSVEPYARARAISEKTDTGLIAEDIAAGSDYAALALAPSDKQRRKKLQASLGDRMAKKLPASPVSAYGWVLLSQLEARDGDTPAALKFADRGLADVEAMGEPIDPVLMRTALVYAGIMRISYRSRNEQSVGEAVRYLERSFAFFPPQKSIDDFDPLLARAMVWRATVGGLAASEPPRVETGSRIETGEDYQKAIDSNSTAGIINKALWQEPRPALCPAIAWEIQTVPKYPDGARRDYQIGATLIGFEMDGAKVKRSVVLADMFESGFGAASVEALKTWRAKSPVSPECARNLLSMFRYHLED